MLWSRPEPVPVSEAEALPGRAEPAFAISGVHAVNGHRITPPFPDGIETAVFALGCFWGAERLYWRLPGVWATAAGYSGGYTPNPTYEETCTGLTGHTESVLVAYDPAVISYDELLRTFFEEHDPTQVNRQGNDVGTQYRSAIYWTTPDQEARARAAAATYERALAEAGLAPVATELAPLGRFWYAEEPHQQYLHKVPNGYCGLRGTGVTCTIGADRPAAEEPTTVDRTPGGAR